MYEITFNPFYKHPISKEIYEIVYENGIKEYYDANKMVLNPYELVDYLFFIDSGMCNYLIVDLNGKEQVLGIIERGACFGTPPLFLDKSSYEACIVTTKPSVIYKISKEKIFNLFETSKIFRDYIIRSFANDCYKLVSYISNISFNSSKKRLYELLLLITNEEPTKNNWYQLNCNYTKEQLAKIIGVSKSTLQYAMYSLRDEGLIRFINNKIEVKIEKDKNGNIVEQKL